MRESHTRSSKFVFSGSAPARIFPVRTATAWPVALVTLSMTFWRNAVFTSFSTMLLPSSSSGEKSPAEGKPVASMTAVTISWRKRNGGFDRSFSVSFGLEMIAPRSRWTSTMSSSREAIVGGRQGRGPSCSRVERPARATRCGGGAAAEPNLVCLTLRAVKFFHFRPGLRRTATTGDIAAGYFKIKWTTQRCADFQRCTRRGHPPPAPLPSAVGEQQRRPARYSGHRRRCGRSRSPYLY